MGRRLRRDPNFEKVLSNPLCAQALELRDFAWASGKNVMRSVGDVSTGEFRWEFRGVMKKILGLLGGIGTCTGRKD